MDNETLLERILNLLKEHGHSVSQMERLCELNRGTTLDAWKRGSRPNVYAIAAIAEYYNVSIDYLMGRTNTKNPDSGISENGRIMLSLYEKLPEREQILLLGRLQEMLSPMLPKEGNRMSGLVPDEKAV